MSVHDHHHYRCQHGPTHLTSGREKILGVERGVLYVGTQGGHGDVVAFHLKDPQVSQLGVARGNGMSASDLFAMQPIVGSSNGRALRATELAPPARAAVLGQSDAQGFSLTEGSSLGLDAAYSLAVSYSSQKVGIFAADDDVLALIDGISLLDDRDAVLVADCISESHAQADLWAEVLRSETQNGSQFSA